MLAYLRDRSDQTVVRAATLRQFLLSFVIETASVSASAQDSIVGLGKAHRRSVPSVSGLPKDCLFVGWLLNVPATC